MRHNLNSRPLRAGILWLAVLLGLLAGAPAAHAQLLRQKAYGTATGQETMGAMASLRAGGYLLGGSQYFGATPNRPGELYLLRLNAVGDTLWTRHYGLRGARGFYVQHALEDAAGRVLLVGSSFTSSGTTQDDAFLALFSPQGDTLWTRRAQSPFQDYYSRPQLTPAGDFVLAANLEGAPQLVRISPSGQRLQQVIVAYSPSDLGQLGLLLPANNGGYWVGAYNSTPPYTGNFVRFDAAGVRGIELPILPNGPAFGDFIYDGNEYIVATGEGVARFDANLNVVWNRTLTARGYLFGPDFIRATPDGNFVVGGGINTTSGGQDLGFAKISPAGLPLRDTVLIRPGNETLCGLAVAPGSGNYVFAGSGSQGPIGGEDIFWGELRRSAVTAARPGLAPANALTAYPNPVGADGVVQLAAGQALRGTLTLRDALGRELARWPGSGAPTQRLALPPSLPAGLYLLTLAPADGGPRQALRLLRP
ncbi:T9SS type A sorting domain-containing protein [Hymenobacter ruricola]|uniref:T9SS type A sorting domain-containing protein n=1 Tax=Hymenobacter ruricola TaxID=2791023 RepID=A0ABS0I0T4_9BACT|nr:T9SS type A sorting domain-containing protein [Hymenobacter ruricola]MBF9220169.1 T9SS type A sorting domain-containing protein [Hymenobacter ruricola]